MNSSQSLRVGIIGTGFIARRFLEVAPLHSAFEICGVYSRRPADASPWLDRERHTSSLDELADKVDVLLELSGDACLATEVCLRAVERKLPVVTMNSEFHVTTGSYFADKIFLTEAHGDQPGCASQLHEEAVQMGFQPLAHLNYKGYINPNPARSEMEYWSERQQLRLEQVVQFTDGSKVQLEQALTANGLGAGIARNGLLGGEAESPMALERFGAAAEQIGHPIADFVQAKGGPPGVALVARHPFAEKLPHYTPFSRCMTPDGKYFVLQRSYHMCHLEIPRTLNELEKSPKSQWRVLLNNGLNPKIGVAAIAKRCLQKGEKITRGLGSFDVRGQAIRSVTCPDHVPLCLLAGAHLRRQVETGDVVCFGDVELPESPALAIYQQLAAQNDEATADRLIG